MEMEEQANRESEEQANNEIEEQAELQEHDEEDDSKKEEEELVAKVNKLMDKITSSPDNPKPNVLHALASILEKQELRYVSSLQFSFRHSTILLQWLKIRGVSSNKLIKA